MDLGQRLHAQARYSQTEDALALQKSTQAIPKSTHRLLVQRVYGVSLAEVRPIHPQVVEG
jgi:hypothetical protein